VYIRYLGDGDLWFRFYSGSLLANARNAGPAKSNQSEYTEELLFCGSWLACDADTSVHQVQRVDAIAGKPAPTFDRVWLCCCCCSYILFADEVSGLLICAFDLDLKSPPKSLADCGHAEP
jgi:hypothetical protein